MQIMNLILLACVCIPLAGFVCVRPKHIDQKWMLGILLGSLGLLPGLIVLGFVFSTDRDGMWLGHLFVSCLGATLAAIVAIRVAAPLLQFDGLGRERRPADDLTDRR